MSHVTLIKTTIADLDAFEKALAEFPGARLVRGQTTYAWFGRHVGDYPIPEGLTKEDLGKCDHAIHVEGVNYEVGLRNGAGEGYRLLFDFYGHGGTHDGQKLKQLFGDGLGLLVQSYNAVRVEQLIRRKGYTNVRRTRDETGRIRIRVAA